MQVLLQNERSVQQSEESISYNDILHILLPVNYSISGCSCHDSPVRYPSHLVIPLDDFFRLPSLHSYNADSFCPVHSTVSVDLMLCYVRYLYSQRLSLSMCKPSHSCWGYFWFCWNCALYNSLSSVLCTLLLLIFLLFLNVLFRWLLCLNRWRHQFDETESVILSSKKND